MRNKEKYCEILEDIIGNKLGGTKYMAWPRIGQNLGHIIAEYIEKELFDKKVSGPYLAIGSSLVRKIRKLSDTEAILTCITESLMTNSDHNN